jgi:hypothetical protein
VPHTTQTDRWRAGRALHHALVNVAAGNHASKGSSLRSMQKRCDNESFLVPIRLFVKLKAAC